MSQPIIFFRKSLMDLSNPNIVITITDSVATNNGQAYVDYVRNRKNDSAWITTDSDDTANTEIEVNFTDFIDFTDVLLIGHNFKAFTVQYWTGVAWLDFSTVISETVNTATTNHYNFNSVSGSKIKVIIDSTQEVDADKFLKQLIVTRKIGAGQLEGWPLIKKPTISTSKKANKMLSGKISLTESIQSYSVTLELKAWSNESDMDIMEDIYFRHQGVLFWPCGGDESQFSSKRIGYRLEDIYLVRPISEYTPEYYQGLYQSGVITKLKLQESVS